MIFVKLDVDMTDHPKFVKAGVAAFGLWAWALAYTRKHELDGFVPSEAALTALGTRDDQLLLECAGKLVEVGLWLSVKDGWEIFNYAEKNECKKEIDKRKRTDRDRKKPVVVRKDSSGIPKGILAQGIPGSGSVSGSVKLLETDVHIAREPSSAHERYAKAYADGQLAAGAEAYPWPDGTAQHGALASMCAFAKGLRGEGLTAWFTATSSEFRRSADAAYSSGYMPTACVKWLSGGRPKAASKGKHLVQQVPVTGRLWKVGGDGK